MKHKIIWPGLFVLIAAGTILGLPAFFYELNGNSITLETLISLIVAILTLEATIFIALYIYSLQYSASQKEASKQESGAKQVLFTEIDTGLETIVRMPKAGYTGDISGHLSEILISFLPSIQYSLSADQLHHLIKLVDALSSMAKLTTSDEMDPSDYIQGWLGLFVQPQFIPAMRSPYANSFVLIDDYHKVLTAITRSTLEALSGQKFSPPVTDRLFYPGQKNPFLTVFPDDRCRITDIDGQLLCNAVFGDSISGIVSGWAKSDTYVGEYKDGKRHGLGTSYHPINHHKLFEGIWENDSPKQGMQFNMVLQKMIMRDGTYRIKDVFPYWDEYNLVSSHVIDYICNRSESNDGKAMADLYVCDVNISDDLIKFEEDDLIPLERFMKENDPQSLSHYQEYCNMVWGDEDEYMIE